MTSTLHILEDAHDVTMWRGKHADLTDSIVVALSPAAALELERADVSYTTIEDYYSETELCAQGDSGNAFAKAMCDDLDEAMGVSFVQDVLPEFSAHYYVGRLRVLYDNFLRASFVLTALLERVAPHSVVLATGNTPDPSGIIIVDTRFLSWIMREILLQKGIPFQELKGVTPSEARRSSLSIARMKQVLVKVSRRGREALRGRFPGRCDIVHHTGVALPVGELAHLGLKTFRLPVFPSPKSTTKKMDFARVGRHFAHHGVDLWRLASPSLDYFAGPFRERHLSWLRKTEKIIRASRARAVVSESAMLTGPVVALLAARRTGVPAVVVQHGGLGGYCRWDMLQFIDMYLNEYFLAYGQGVVDAMRPYALSENRVRSKSIAMRAVGAGSVWRIWQKRDAWSASQKRRALYVTNPLVGSARYMAGHQRSDFIYWNAKRRVLRTMLSYSGDWEIHFRPPPNTTDLVYAELSEEDREKVKLRTGGTLDGILREEKFDLIVIDTLATAFLQSLATDAPVVTWVDQERMQCDLGALELMARRVTVCYSPDDYADAVAQAMRASRGAGAAVDDQFLFQYALADRENPDVLEARALKQIIDGDFLEGVPGAANRAAH